LCIHKSMLQSALWISMPKPVTMPTPFVFLRKIPSTISVVTATSVGYQSPA
jgi:hypothetical protein